MEKTLAAEPHPAALPWGGAGTEHALPGPHLHASVLRIVSLALGPGLCKGLRGLLPLGLHRRADHVGNDPCPVHFLCLRCVWNVGGGVGWIKILLDLEGDYCVDICARRIRPGCPRSWSLG